MAKNNTVSRHDQDIDELDQQFLQMSDAEISAFDSFEKKHARMYPPPKRANPHLGWEFMGALLTSIAAVVLAAFRTAQAFYMAAVYGANPIFAGLEAASAVIAIEGGVVMFSIRNAYGKGKTTDQASLAGVWIAFLISAFAGLFQSTHLLGASGSYFDNILRWSLVIFMGLGATIIAWLGGNIMGVQLVKLEKARKSSSEQLSKSMKSYRGNMLREWKKSQEHDALSNKKGEHYRTTKMPLAISSDRSSANGSGERSRTASASKEEIYAILDKVLTDNGSIAGVSDVSRSLAKARNSDGTDYGFERFKGHVSEVRKEWMRERGIEPKV